MHISKIAFILTALMEIVTIAMNSEECDPTEEVEQSPIKPQRLIRYNAYSPLVDSSITKEDDLSTQEISVSDDEDKENVNNNSFN